VPRRARVFLAAVALIAASVPLAAPAADAAKKSPNTQAKQAWTRLINDTKRLPRKAVKRKIKRQMLRAERRGRKLARRAPCRSRRVVRRLRRLSRKVKAPRRRGRRPVAGSNRGRLRADLVSIDAALLAHPRARRCGGARASGQAEAKSTVLSSTEKTLKMRVQLPPAQFNAHQVGGKDYLEMTMEGMGQSGDVGDPGLPILTNHFAIPEGANVSVKVSNAKSYKLKGVDLYPTQPQPVDGRPQGDVPLQIADIPGAPQRQDFQEPPFKIDRKAVRSKGPFPEGRADGGSIGAIRDLQVGGVDTVGGQYRPRSKTLSVFTSIDVTVNFGGANKGTFGDSRLLSPWNHAFQNTYGGLKNLETVLDRLRPIRPVFCGEELLIITSSELRPAANTLQSQRIAQGYSTSVREVGAGPGQIGTTPAQIQSFIRSRLNGGCLVRPSYVILFGNTAHVPTFLVPCSPGGNPDDCNIASDLDYSLNGIGTDLFADVQLGRLPAPSLDAANALVTKLQTYATTSPAPPGDDFFDHAAVTSYFQPPMICVLNEGATGTPNCNGDAPPVTGHWEIDYPANTDTRGFTITAERIRNAIAGDGYAVDRLYTTDDEDVIPLNYWNGTPIPSHLRRPAFAWDANTTDFFNAYNEGRFVILHRDHGWPDGWAEPTLHSGHVPLFTNGSQQPVVFGINCSSAAFDTPAHPSFVELQLLRPDGGAIAGFGDTRVSPSFPNNHMALGFFDAMFPLAVPDYGSDPGTRRLGDILVLGKQYMATQEGFEWHGAGDTYVEHYLYHLLGDPTMQMWSNPPERFNPDRIRSIIRQIREIRPPRPGDPPFFVEVRLPPGEPPANGALVTLFRNGTQAIGRGIVANGVAQIIPEVAFDDRDNLNVALQHDGALPAQDKVENPPRQSTSLTANCAADGQLNSQPMTTTGRLTGAPGGSDVEVTYTRPDGTSFTREVVTDADGDWSDTFEPADEAANSPQRGDGTWSVKARYAGDDDRSPSESATCTVQVIDNF
jgi:hypothetical protein